METLSLTRKIRTVSTGEPSNPAETPNRTSVDLSSYVQPVITPRVWSSLISNATLAPLEDDFAGVEKTLYALCKAKRDLEAIDEALDYFDDRLIARQFRECDRAFRRLQVNTLASSVMVSILGITIRAKTLKGRAIFFERAFQEIARRKGKKYANELLAKYR